MFRVKRKIGFSLAELLMAVFILSIGIVSSLFFFTSALISSEFARDMTEATTHTEHVLEEMKTRSSLSNITGTNWSSWASGQNVFTLPSETLTVAYVNSSADPLDVQATTSWTKKNRTNNVSLRTQVHK